MKKSKTKNLTSLFFFLCSLSSLSNAAELRLFCPQGQILFNVELAQTPEQCAKGLMHREKLDDDEGMLFLFPQPGPKTMWMKNTPLSLDMIFINPKGNIVAIKENTVPNSLDLIGPIENTVYVLEILGGTTKRKRISQKCYLEQIASPQIY